MLDYLEALKEAGVQVSAARYIGMGGTKFYDFAMMHRFLAITDLVSCERTASIATRGQFNRPFATIKVLHEEVGKYLQSKLKDKTAVCWLDYDDALGPDIIGDIATVGKELRVDSSVFVTVASGMPRDFLEMTEAERLAQLTEEFGAFAGDVTIDDVEEASFVIVSYRILMKAFVNAFSGRTDGTWNPYFQVQYKDSTSMLTVGGSFLSTDTAKRLKPIVRRRLPFLKATADRPYKIRSFNVTERERHLFEFSASARSNSAEANTLRRLGFSTADLRGYRELVRFMPRYVEAYN